VFDMNDPQSTPELLSRLAETSQWAQSLATRLVGDEHLAEDVVQEAYLAALQTPGRPRSVSAWFSGAVKNLSRRKLRDRVHGDRREQAAARAEALPAASDTAARLEQQELLIRALLELDEPYRGSVLARYVDGLQPREIADRDGVPVATVNSRLARGLGRLRAHLKRAHGGDTTRWIAALLPLTKPSVVVKGSWILGVPLMKKAFAAAIALLLISISVWVSTHFSVDEVVTPARGPLRSEVDSLARDTAPSPLEVARSQAAAREVRGRELATPPAQEVEATRVQRLRLVDSSNGEGLASCQLFVLSSDQWKDVQTSEAGLAAYRENPGGARSLMREMGRGYRADSHGRIAFPMAEERVSVLASIGELSACEYVRWTEEEQVLELAADHELRVRVVDLQGRGVSRVPVALISRTHGRDIPLARSLSGGESGRVGEATLALWEGVHDQLTERMLVTLDFPLAEPVALPVYRTKWPQEPLILVMPPVGAVLLDARGIADGGRPVGRRAMIRETPLDEPAWYGGPGSLLANLGPAAERFWPVGLGLELTASVWLHDDQEPATRSFQGPARSGQELTVDMQIGGRLVAFHGRLLEADGEPVRSEYLQVRIGDELGERALELDSKGGFRFECMEYVGEPIEGRLTISDHSDQPAREASVAIQITDSSASCDLGVLHLPAPAVLQGGSEDSIGGRVLDIAGEGISGATVRWVEPLEGESGDHTWTSCGVRSGRTDSRGTFRISSELPHAQARLQAVARNGLYHEPEEVERLELDPDGGYLLRMQPGASLRGRLALDTGIDPAQLELSLWNLAGGPASDPGLYGWIYERVERDGSFEFQGLAAGRYTLRAGIGEGHSLAGLVEDIALIVGDNHDPRLEPLDLRGLFRSFDLMVVDEQGLPVRAAVYSFQEILRDGRTLVAGPDWVGTTSEDALLLGAEPEYALMLDAQGYFPVLIDPLDPPNEVVMRRGRELELEWTGPIKLAELPARLQLELVPLSSDHPVNRATRYLRTLMRPWSPGRVYLDATDATRTRVPRAGTYRLIWTIDYEYRSGHHMNREIELETDQLLSVGDELDRYQVALDRAVLEREIEWLRERFAERVERGYIPADLPFGGVVPD